MRTKAPGTGTVLAVTVACLAALVAASTWLIVTLAGVRPTYPAPATTGTCLTIDLHVTDCNNGDPTWVVVGTITPKMPRDDCARFNAYADTDTTDHGTILCLSPIWEVQP